MLNKIVFILNQKFIIKMNHKKNLQHNKNLNVNLY